VKFKRMWHKLKQILLKLSNTDRNRKREMLKKSYKAVFGTEGLRNSDQQRVFDDLITGNIFKTTLEEKALDATARDLAIKTQRLIYDE
jgi:hypothetical protein